MQFLCTFHLKFTTDTNFVYMSKLKRQISTYPPCVLITWSVFCLLVCCSVYGILTYLIPYLYFEADSWSCLLRNPKSEKPLSGSGKPMKKGYCLIHQAPWYVLP